MMQPTSQPQHPWDQFKDLKDEAYLYIDQGLRLEQTSKPDRAQTMYERGLDKLDQALDLPFELPGSSSEDLERVRKNRTKMLRTRQEIVFRIRELSASNNGHISDDTNCRADKEPDPGPSLIASSGQEVATVAASGAMSHEPPPSYEHATSVGGETELLPSDALILFQIPDRVSIFYINECGKVTTPYQPASLYLYKFKDPTEVESAPAMLQVGSWVYPLVPGKSPVLQSSNGSYMFPDLDDSLSGNAVGLIFPPEVSEDEKAGFELLLNQLTAVQQSEDLSHYEEYITLSGHVAEGMTQGAEAIGRGLVRASTKGAELMKIGTIKLKENVAPTLEDREVDPKLKASLEAASWTADKAVKVSGYLVSKAGTATVALGRFLAPHIQRGSVKALSHFVEQSEEKSQKQMRIVSDVASGSVAAISTVYMALENSSKILAKNIGENTVEVVKHKYGQEVGQVTDNALSAAGNAYLAVYNAGALAPKGLAKRLAKDTGKVAVGVPDEVLQGNINLEEPQPGPVNPDPQLQSFDYESGIEQGDGAAHPGSTTDPNTKSSDK